MKIKVKAKAKVKIKIRATLPLTSWISQIHWTALDVVLGGVLFFSVLYVGFALASVAITRFVLPGLGVGRVLDPRPLNPHQVRREIALSALSC